MPIDLEELLVPDVAAWREWLASGPATGVSLVLAKKGTTQPTSLTYDQALEEALCVGWIDGRVNRRDESTYYCRFTPRRPRGVWSARNVEIVQRLAAEGRMTPSGLAEVERAKADGRWDAAYPGAATMEVPADLVAALEDSPAASKTFGALDAQSRYVILYRLHNARRAENRSKMLQRFVDALARGEAP